MEAKARDFNFVKEGILQIPFFQRSYVWKKEQWEKFFNDLHESYNSKPKKEHFLGSIVLKRQEKLENEILVIDGQQRLTTFSILVKVLFDNLENDKKQYFRELLFAQYRDDEPRICHSKLDKEKFRQIILNTPSPNPKEEGLIGCYNYFSRQISEKLKNEVFEFLHSIVESKMWVVVCLNSNEDEQKIFDSINSTGEKLTVTDIVKNSLFDQAIRTFGEEKAMALYEEFWRAIFEDKDEDKKFWDEEIKKSGRTRSETSLYITALIEGFFDIDKDNLNNLSLLYKQKIQTLESKEEFEKFLSKIAEHATIYRKFPLIKKETVLYYEDWNTRLFHIIENTQTSTVMPLIVFLRSHIQEEKILQECFYLLEILILCNEDTKNYNKFFVKIIEKIIKLPIKENIPQQIRSEILKYYSLDQDFTRNWLLEWGVVNSDAKLILFWIEAWREYCQKDYKDKVGLQYVYTLEHLMPIKWEKHWKHIGVNQKNAEKLIYQLGNMTLLKRALNNELKNSDWTTKINGDGRARNYIRENADLLITKELLNKTEWTSQNITERTEKFIEDFNKVWDISLLNKSDNK